MCCPAICADAAAVEALPKAAAEAMGSVDILVNNAGITRDNLFMRMSDDGLAVGDRGEPDRVHSGCAAGVLRGMMKARWGRIVNITSVVGATGNPGQANYAASKAGVIGMSKIAGARGGEPGHHRQLRGAGVHRHRDDRQAERRAEGADPGADSGRADGRGRQRSRRRCCIWPVAEAGYVTGATLHVNGGMAMI